MRQASEAFPMSKAPMCKSIFAIAVSTSLGASLQVGGEFPAIAGHTLSGAPLELPEREAGSAEVVVFSFSKTGGTDARLWNEQLDRDFGASTGVSRWTPSCLGLCRSCSAGRLSPTSRAASRSLFGREQSLS